MSAGLPGVGLSGVFFILSALVALPLEVVRAIRGQSSFARWAQVLRHCALAIAMIALMELFYAALHVALTGLLHRHPDLANGLLVGGHAESGVHARMIPALPVLATLGLVALVMGLAKGAELVARFTGELGESNGARMPEHDWPSDEDLVRQIIAHAYRTSSLLARSRPERVPASRRS
jgi:hypothetical protein